MLPIFGNHARGASAGWKFTEYACGYPNGCVYHPGWDFNLSNPNDAHQNVYAIADGTVVSAAPHYPTTWGSVIIEHNINGQHFYSQYGHCEEVFVIANQQVHKGNRIAKVGDIGAQGAYHLHWEIRTTSHENPALLDYWTDNLKNQATVESWYRNPERMIVRLDIDAERQSQGEGNYGSLVQDNDWFIPLNADAPYNGDNTPKTCYVQRWSGGTFGPCGVIYDALGGTRTAYTVRNGFWGTWNGAGGPSSSIGIPITNEYNNGGSTARQDFQKGYLYWNGSSVSVNYYPNCSPGWTSSGWNNQYSYLFARAYERNGARNALGEAIGQVNGWNGFFRQNFTDGRCVIYDPNNAVDNSAATNEAYYLTGNFYTVYFQEYPSAWQTIGPPTRDREGNVQYFKTGRMVEEANGVIRVYNASGQQVWTNYVGGAGGGGDPYVDLAVLYDYGGCQTRAHTFLSTGSTFNYQGNEGWAILNNYCLQYVVRSVSGDFDGNGVADVAMLYQYGECSVGIHVLLSTGASFTYQPYWWQSSGFCPYAIRGMVAGDFNGDGKDDIATVYDFGNNQIRIFVLLSTGSGFAYQPGNEAWLINYSYDGSAVKFVNAGDLNADGKDDIVMAYRYGPSSTALHVFLSTGSSFTYQSFWFWADGWFALDAMKFMEMGDLNGDGKCDVVMACRYGSNEMALLTFLSTGTGFNYQGWWYHNVSYSLDAVKYMAVGDITGDGLADVAMSYLYSEYSGAIHCFTSSGSGFNYSPWWWQSTSYGWDHTNGFFLGKFDGSGTPKVLAGDQECSLPLMFQLNQNYPNPFNPATVIAYTLPSATHVTLEVYNVLGQRVTTLVDEQQTAGEHTATWDANPYSSGVYFYRLRAGEATETKKMLLLK
ncbi:MAG: FG-GAP-like repeat-containing protein [Patescibacteria group bacterium]